MSVKIENTAKNPLELRIADFATCLLRPTQAERVAAAAAWPQEQEPTNACKRLTQTDAGGTAAGGGPESPPT